jgi:predicted anti-sigma-YlaC factor YlaD
VSDTTVGPECEAGREAMSAHLDGEPSPLSASWLTEHLVECAECRRWYAGAADLRRRTRLTLVPAVPDMTDRILAAVRDRSGPGVVDPPRISRRVMAWRLLLAATAAVQLWFAVPVLLFARDHDVTTHPAHELGSYTTALAVGFAVVAWRPRLARGMRPLVGIIALLLVTTAVIDLAHSGRTTFSDEAPHLLSVAGYLLMSALTGDRTERPSRVQRGSGDLTAATGVGRDPTQRGNDATVAPPRENYPTTGSGGRATA